MSNQQKQKLLSSKESYCSSLETVELLESVRELPPLHYRFKIESFIELGEALKRMKIDHLESSNFSAGGYKWVLCIYPNGKKTENGGGHISLYLKLVDEVAGEEDIHATIKFFIYDHLHDRYLIIHDPRGKRFDATITQWGIPRLIALSTFKDPDNGFLINDSCVFGVEILFPGENSRSMSTIFPAQDDLLDSEDTYVWKIERFSTVKKDIYSSVFSLGGYEWYLHMYPFGDSESKGNHLSLHLISASKCEKTTLLVKFELYLKDQVSGKHKCHEKQDEALNCFSNEAKCWGYSHFISLVDLNNPLNGYKQNDTIIIEVKILDILVLKDM